MEEYSGNDGFDKNDNPDDLWLQDNMDWDYSDAAEEEPDEEVEEQAPPTKQLRIGATPSRRGHSNVDRGSVICAARHVHIKDDGRGLP